MTALPFEVEEKEEEVQYRHNWLYSVLPASPFPETFGPTFLYLAGYCRFCDQAFSKMISTSLDDSIVVTKMDIPKWGCKNPNGV